MITTLFSVKNTNIKFSYLCTGVVGLAILSSGEAWLAILLAFGFCFHLWQSFERNNWSMIITSSAAGLLFVVLFSAHLLLDVPLFWVVLAILLCAVVGLLNDESDEPKVSMAPKQVDDAFVEESPLSVFASKKELRQGYYVWCDDTQVEAVLIIIRLEGFEQVNQHIGRGFGDILLAQSANRIQEQLESEEVVTIVGHEKLAHLGGLNFAFICSLANHKHLHEQIIDKILGATLKPFNVANCTVEVKARASYVACDEQETNFDDLISYAYLALDSQPKQRVVPYHQQMMVEQLEQQARLKELANIDFASAVSYTHLTLPTTPYV